MSTGSRPASASTAQVVGPRAGPGVDRDPDGAARTEHRGPARHGRSEQVERAALQAAARPAAVLHAVRRVGDDASTLAARKIVGVSRVSACATLTRDRVAGRPRLLVDGELGVEPAARGCVRRGAAGSSRRVLEPLVLQPARQERGVGLDVALVDVDPGGVPAVHERLVERRTAAAERVEDPEPLGEHPVGGCATPGPSR